MSQQPKLLLLLGIAALCGGCVGTGPNTQQDAVAGGALGAIAGAIIGGPHNALGGAILGGTVGAIAGGTIGNSIDNERGTLYHTEGEATTTVVVSSPPPPPVPPPYPQVIPPAPTPDSVWLNGYYLWNGQAYVWVAPHWVIPPPGYRVYVAPHWAWRHGDYVYVRGYWRM